MSKLELNQWAVMNLSMEDRGANPIEEAVQRGAAQAQGASRFLSGNLSYFGVIYSLSFLKLCQVALRRWEHAWHGDLLCVQA